MNVPAAGIKDEDIKNFLDTIKIYSGYDFESYSIKTLKRRLKKILDVNRFTMPELLNNIAKDNDFTENVINSITVSSTELFRDPEVWRIIKNDILPAYFNREVIRIWHPGCSTGQEVYSMMILLSEYEILEKTEIYASDINSFALKQAKEGKYKSGHLYLENFDTVFNDGAGTVRGNVRYEKYFIIDKSDDNIQMKDFLINKPRYKQIDLAKAENLFNTSFDLIVCRNVIFYFNYELQNSLFNLFYSNLNTNGCLVLGLNETIPEPSSFHYKKQNGFYYKRIT